MRAPEIKIEKHVMFDDDVLFPSHCSIVESSVISAVTQDFEEKTRALALVAFDERSSNGPCMKFLFWNLDYQEASRFFPRQLWADEMIHGEFADLDDDKHFKQAVQLEAFRQWISEDASVVRLFIQRVYHTFQRESRSFSVTFIN